MPRRNRHAGYEGGSTCHMLKGYDDAPVTTPADVTTPLASASAGPGCTWRFEQCNEPTVAKRNLCKKHLNDVLERAGKNRARR